MTTFTVTATGSTTPHALSSKISSPTTLQTVISASSEASSKQKTRRIVVKFGGSSLADKNCIAKAACLVSKETAKGTRLVVAVSAMGCMTDQLIGLVNNDRAPDKTDLGDVLAMGEGTSVRIFATALKAEGLEARYFDPTERGINIFGMLTLASSVLVFVSWDERETALNLMRQVVRSEL